MTNKQKFRTILKLIEMILVLTKIKKRSRWETHWWKIKNRFTWVCKHMQNQDLFDIKNQWINDTISINTVIKRISLFTREWLKTSNFNDEKLEKFKKGVKEKYDS